MARLRLKPRAMLACIALAITATAAMGGHELPVYPSYYPHEITIATVSPGPAADLLRAGKIQAYLGTGWPGSGEPPATLRAIESLGSFVILTVNPTSPLANDPDCTRIAAIIRELAGSGGFVFHPHPVTPFHGDYLYHLDHLEAARERFGNGPNTAIASPVKIKVTAALGDVVPIRWRTEGPDWDAAIGEVDAANLVVSSSMAINGWLGPAWIKTGWYQAERLLAGAVVEDEIRRRNDELSRRLKEGDYRDAAERLNLERDLVGALTSGCNKIVLGYTTKRQYYNAEFTDGVENIGFDAIGGLNSTMFLRTVKLKNFPWNGWLALGLDGAPQAAWNPIAGFGDAFGQLLWSAIGDPALVPAPYDMGWMLNRVSNVQSSVGR